jgi:hypothetical protein
MTQSGCSALRGSDSLCVNLGCAREIRFAPERLRFTGERGDA